MIEDFLTAVVKELGATGVLLLGLTVLLLHISREISTPLKTINHEIGEIRDLLRDISVDLKK